MNRVGFAAAFGIIGGIASAWEWVSLSDWGGIGIGLVDLMIWNC